MTPMDEVRCFILEPTPRVKLWLRRFHFTYPVDQGFTKCSGPFGGHNAKLEFQECEARFDAEGYLRSFEDLAPPHDDPRWPRKCDSCAYEFPMTGEYKVVDHHGFHTDGNWQVFQRQLYRRPDTGEIVMCEDAPPGAMWDAWWMSARYACADGKKWTVKLPNGCEWCAGGPSRNEDGTDGTRWTVTGTAPNFTASPSIWSNKGRPNDWHGFLTDGILRHC